MTVHFSFPIQTSDATFFLNEMRMLHRFTVGFGIVFYTRTESAAKMRVADFTASGDLHPAPKNIPFSAKNIAQDERNCKLFFSQIGGHPPQGFAIDIIRELSFTLSVPSW